MLQQLNNKYLYIVVLILSTIFGMVWRVWMLFVSNLFRDEAFTGILAKRDFKEILEIVLRDGNVPLHPLLLHIYGFIFGYSDLAIRSFSLIIFVISLPIIYLISTRLNLTFKLKALFFSFIMLSSTMIYYSIEARYYGLITLEFLCIFFLILSILKEKSHKILNALLLGLTILASLYTHNVYTIIIASIFTSLVFYFFYLHKLDVKEILKDKRIYYLLSSFMIAFVGYIPWLFVITKQAKMINSSFWLTFDPINSIRDTLFNIFATFYYVNFELKDLLIMGGAFIALTFFGYGLYKNIQDKEKNILAILTILVFVFYYLVSFKQPILYVRYISFITPFVLLLTLIGIRSLKEVYLKLFFLGIVIFFFIFYNLTFALPRKENNIYVKNVVTYSLENCLEGCKVVHQSSLTYFNIEFYSEEKIKSLIYDKDLSTPTYVGKALIPNERFITSANKLLEEKVFYLVEGEIDMQNKKDFEKTGYNVTSVKNFETNLVLYEFKK